MNSESCVLLHYIAEQRVSPERLPCCICPVIKHIPLTSYPSLQVDLRPLIDLDTRLRDLIDEDLTCTCRRDLSRERNFLDLRALVDDTDPGKSNDTLCLISVNIRIDQTTISIDTNLNNKVLRIKPLRDCDLFELIDRDSLSKIYLWSKIFTVPISLSRDTLRHHEIGRTWRSIHSEELEIIIRINRILIKLLMPLWVWTSKSLQRAITRREIMQSQLPQIRHSIGDYIYIYVHIFTIMIGKRMHSWDYWDYLMRMLLTIRKLKLDTPTILQIKDPGIRGISLFRLQKLFIISSRIDLFALKSLSTLGIGESFDFKPLCHCLHWSHQHQHEDHDDPW